MGVMPVQGVAFEAGLTAAQGGDADAVPVALRPQRQSRHIQQRGKQIVADVRKRDIPTPVIVMTEYITEGLEYKIRGIGVDFFFVKPIDMNALWEVSEKLFTIRDRKLPSFYT